MKNRSTLMAAGILLAASISLSAFGLNYNASKSNTGNFYLVHTATVSASQTSAILAQISKSGKAPTEAAVQNMLAAAGVEKGKIAKVIVQQMNGSTVVLLLDDPGDVKNAVSVANITTSRSNTQHNN